MKSILKFLFPSCFDSTNNESTNHSNISINNSNSSSLTSSTHTIVITRQSTLYSEMGHISLTDSKSVRSALASTTRTTVSTSQSILYSQVSNISLDDSKSLSFVPISQNDLSHSKSSDTASQVKSKRQKGRSLLRNSQSDNSLTTGTHDQPISESKSILSMLSEMNKESKITNANQIPSHPPIQTQEETMRHRLWTSAKPRKTDKNPCGKLKSITSSASVPTFSP